MSGAANSTSHGLAATAIDALAQAPRLPLGVALALVGIMLAQRLLAPRLDPREPPVLKPRIPLVGHIIGLLRHRSNFFGLLRAQNPMPIATLPMLNGKLYALWSPGLIHAAMRHKDLSFDIL